MPELPPVSPHRQTQHLHAGRATSLKMAARLLRAGELVAFPTDTVYGLGALFDQEAAVEGIYHVKGRPESKGIPILLASASDLPLVVNVGVMGQMAARLASAFWPGPLTLVLPKNSSIPAAVSRTETVAVRVPEHALTRALIALVGRPLAVTSANHSGQPPTIDPATVRAMLGGRIAAILDGGLAPGGEPSTIVDCSGGALDILRHGPIREVELMTALQRRGED